MKYPDDQHYLTFENYEELSNEQLEVIEKKVAAIREKRKWNGFRSQFITFNVGVDSYQYDTVKNLLSIHKNGSYILSQYQFLLDAANRGKEKPFIVKNILDYMIQILTAIRSGIR